ncbi:hypothetical protein F2Q69_00051362 [Brassica cretica]|uniref:Uncharacterized protein n=1 Tax=Brassica cretica TaxID=69181 RepID=A0A8S9PW39_BRACR|nr:hypothetical protein F2Q69_00051362 [Brassica cretica]
MAFVTTAEVCDAADSECSSRRKGNGRVLVEGANDVQYSEATPWFKLIVNGCIRDVDEINGCDIGVRALASHPIKASKKGLGEQ